MQSSFFVVQISDPHLLADAEGCLLGVNTDHSLRGVIDDIKRREPQVDVVLATGDIAQDGSVQAYERFLHHASAINAPVYGLPGNHDDGDTLRSVWQARLDPVVDLGNWRIVLLDSSVPGSNSGHLAQSQFDVLQAAATQAHDRHVLVAVHHNPVPMGSPWLDGMTIDNGDALFQMLERLPNVRCLLWGHIHQEYDDVHQYSPTHGLRLLASPSTCVQFKPYSETFELDTVSPAYRWLRLHANGDVETGVQRVEGLGVYPDLGGTRY
ncbi:3',5'-cyclic-AMP phosphodiesterase [Alcaligenaceae bacterium]|nr:3',5'-cyclic-AMP phosphodiesterase [Alcaligenaceae bacterium]